MLSVSKFTNKFSDTYKLRDYIIQNSAHYIATLFDSMNNKHTSCLFTCEKQSYEPIR